MKKNEKIDKIKYYLKENFMVKGDGHDYWHMLRVYKTAMEIQKEEGGDCEVIAMSSLLHDVADHKFLKAGETEERKLGKILNELDISGEIREKIEEIILNLSYKGGKNKYEYNHIEGKIVRDADRLDSIGAIGIARAFSYGGSKGRSMYQPEDSSSEFFDCNKEKNEATIEHFYTKLLKLKDGFYTKTAQKRAVKRHGFMETYLEEFFDEWNGKV